VYPAHQSLVLLDCLGIHHLHLEYRDCRCRDRATGKQQMHRVLALFAPDHAIERRKGQTCTHVYRPDNGDPIHRVVARNSEVLFVGWIANLTEGHLPTANRVANAKLLIQGSLIIPLLFKIPPFNIFSGKGGAKFSKNEQFSSRPLSTCSRGNSGMKFAKRFRFGQKFE